MNRITTVAAAAAAALSLAACESPAKAPAEAGIKAAEAALEAARAEAQKFAPDKLKAAEDAVAVAKAKFASKEFPAALAAANEAGAKVKDLALAARAKKDELTAAWKAAAGQWTARSQAIQAKLAELAKARKLPKGLDKAAVQKAKEDAEALAKDWSDAAAKFAGGQVLEAVAVAKGLIARAEGIASRLGAEPAAAPAAAPAAK